MLWSQIQLVWITYIRARHKYYSVVAALKRMAEGIAENSKTNKNSKQVFARTQHLEVVDMDRFDFGSIQRPI